MSMNLWNRIKDVTVTGKLRLGRGATIVNSDGGTFAGTNGFAFTPGATAGGLFFRDTLFRKQAAPATATATATLTVAQMLAGILVATPGAAVAYTFATGTALRLLSRAVWRLMTHLIGW